MTGNSNIQLSTFTSFTGIRLSRSWTAPEIQNRLPLSHVAPAELSRPAIPTLASIGPGIFRLLAVMFIVLVPNLTGGVYKLLPEDPLRGIIPQAIVVADFNGDGNQDMAVADSAGRTVRMLLGNGAGQFVESPGNTIFLTGEGKVSLAVADFNNDGKADLAIADQMAGKVTIFLGNGSGGFTPMPDVYLPRNSAPLSIVAKDLNGDGNPDIATADAGTNSISVLYGAGDGTVSDQGEVSILP